MRAHYANLRKLAPSARLKGLGKLVSPYRILLADVLTNHNWVATGLVISRKCPTGRVLASINLDLAGIDRKASDWKVDLGSRKLRVFWLSFDVRAAFLQLIMLSFSPVPVFVEPVVGKKPSIIVRYDRSVPLMNERKCIRIPLD